MKRRDFLAAAGGALTYSAVHPIAATRLLAQDAVGTRTIDATASDRLQSLYSSIPNTPQYEAMARSDAFWADIAKQMDAFGVAETPEDVPVGATTAIILQSLGPYSATDPDAHHGIPVFAAEQIVQLGLAGGGARPSS